MLISWICFSVPEQGTASSWLFPLRRPLELLCMVYKGLKGTQLYHPLWLIHQSFLPWACITCHSLSCFPAAEKMQKEATTAAEWGCCLWLNLEKHLAVSPVRRTRSAACWPHWTWATVSSTAYRYHWCSLTCDWWECIFLPGARYNCYRLGTGDDQNSM